MERPKEPQPICARCEQKPATTTYAHAGLTKALCSACFDRWSIQNAYEGALAEISDLECADQFDDALHRLDAILDANRERDHEGWLARSIAHHRVLVLLDAARHGEALTACQAWENLGFANMSERWQHATATGCALEGLGRDKDAFSALQASLNYPFDTGDVRDLPTALGVLLELVRFSEKLNLPIDGRWLQIARQIAVRCGVEMPADNPPTEALHALQKILYSGAWANPELKGEPKLDADEKASDADTSDSTEAKP